MAQYEMPVIFKTLGLNGLKEALRRHLTCMLENKALIFGVESLGHRRLPQVFHVQGERQYEGHYFLINFTAPSQSLAEIRVC